MVENKFMLNMLSRKSPCLQISLIKTKQLTVDLRLQFGKERTVWIVVSGFYSVSCHLSLLTQFMTYLSQAYFSSDTRITGWNITCTLLPCIFIIVNRCTPTHQVSVNQWVWMSLPSDVKHPHMSFWLMKYICSEYTIRHIKLSAWRALVWRHIVWCLPCPFKANHSHNTPYI